MKTVIVTGASGLVGSEAVNFFCLKGFRVIGIDNDLRKQFFGEEASTAWNSRRLSALYPDHYLYIEADIRSREAMGRIFDTYSTEIELIIHAAAQPSHDWAAKDPRLDFSINATGTLELLEHTRQYCPKAVFIFCSTNKVYGDAPNRLPLVEKALRWEIEAGHVYEKGIDENLSIDQSMHSLFGASKVAADLLVQEYGRYFGMYTASFRGGCLTGPKHSGAQLHGFLSYLMKCTMTEIPYTVFGYQGKQVRDNIHSQDLINAFYAFYCNPRKGEVYNIGGSRFSNCSMLEAIAICESITGKKLQWTYQEQHRKGDHIWWISDIRKFQEHYPEWQLQFSIEDILQQIQEENQERWVPEKMQLSV